MPASGGKISNSLRPANTTQAEESEHQLLLRSVTWKTSSPLSLRDFTESEPPPVPMGDGDKGGTEDHLPVGLH